MKLNINIKLSKIPIVFHVFAGDGNKNFPPLPKCCCIGPCFYHDISMDIPVDHQRTCRMVFFAWQCEFLKKTFSYYT